MRYVAILILLIACLCSHAQTDIYSTNVVTWNLVTNDSDGAPLSSPAFYTLSVWNVGASNYNWSFFTQTNDYPVASFYNLLTRETNYELRVRAESTGLTPSVWSDPLIVRRPKGQAGKPAKPLIR